jgi:O-antigen/teichoic acid export membrane protein
MPFLIRSLGNVAYGIWILILSTTSHMGIFNFDIKTAAIKYVAQFKAKEEKNKINEVISTSFFSYAVLGILVFLMTLIFAKYLGRIFKFDPHYIHEAKLAFVFVGLNVALNLPLGVFYSVILGYQRYDINSYIEISMLVLRTTLIVFFIKLGYGLLALGLITITVNLLGQTVRIWYAFRLNNELQIKLKMFNKKTLKLISNYGFFVILITVAGQVIFYTDNIIIGYFMGASAVTFYAVGSRIVDYYRNGISVLGGVLMPTLSYLQSKNEIDKIVKLYILITKYTLFIVFPIAFIFLFMGENFITLWVGKKYISSYLILIILFLPYIFAPSQHIIKSISFGTGRLKTYSYLNIAEALANLILSIILIQKYGIFGVAIGTSIPLIINRGFILPIYICGMLKLPVFRFIKEAFTGPIIAAIPFAILIYLVSRYTHIKSLTLFVLEIGIILSVYFLFIFRFSLPKTEKAFITSLSRS